MQYIFFLYIERRGAPFLALPPSLREPRRLNLHLLAVIPEVYAVPVSPRLVMREPEGITYDKLREHGAVNVNQHVGVCPCPKVAHTRVAPENPLVRGKRYASPLNQQLSMSAA